MNTFRKEKIFAQYWYYNCWHLSYCISNDTLSQILKKLEVVTYMRFSDYWRLGHAFCSLPQESGMWDGRRFSRVHFRTRFTFLYIFLLLAAMEVCRIGRVMDLFNSHVFPPSLIPFPCGRNVSYWSSVLLLSPHLHVPLGGCTRSLYSWKGASQLPAPQNHWFLLKHTVLCWMVRMMERNLLKTAVSLALLSLQHGSGRSLEEQSCNEQFPQFASCLPPSCPFRTSLDPLLPYSPFPFLGEGQLLVQLALTMGLWPARVGGCADIAKLFLLGQGWEQ